MVKMLWYSKYLILPAYLFIFTLIFSACESKSRRGVKDPTIVEASPPSGTPVDPKPINGEIQILKFYFENSGSMFGYVEGHSEIKNVITRMLSQVEYQDLELYLINNKLSPLTTVKASDFTQRLTPQGINVGDPSTSDLNMILKTVLDSTAENGVGVLITDGIYSVAGDPQTVLGKLKDASNFTYRHFKDHLEQYPTTQTVIIKLQSRFNGRYYPMGGGSTKIDQQRPYYLWLIGSADKLAVVQKDAPYSELPGYKNHVVFQVNKAEQLNYTIIPSLFSKGKFRPSRDEGQRHNTVTNTEKDRNSKEFQVAVGVDLRSIPVEEAYLLNRSNYSIANNDQYKIKSIVPVASLGPNEANMTKNHKYITHIITLNTSNNPFGSLEIVLKNKMPHWVQQTHIADDTNTSGDEEKTLGFADLVDGIERAYRKASSSTDYARFKINIQN